MAAGFPFATDIGIRIEDVEEWGLRARGAVAQEPEPDAPRTCATTAPPTRRPSSSPQGQRVELNMFTGPHFIEFVERKLQEHGVEKVVPDDQTLADAWKRAHARSGSTR